MPGGATSVDVQTTHYIADHRASWSNTINTSVLYPYTVRSYLTFLNFSFKTPNTPPIPQPGQERGSIHK